LRIPRKIDEEFVAVEHCVRSGDIRPDVQVFPTVS
jgi:hypothetical protein